MTTDLLAFDRSMVRVALIRGMSATETDVVPSGPGARPRLGGPLTQGPPAWGVIEGATPKERGIDAAVYHFAKRVGRIPGVFAVTHARDGDMNMVWTFMRRRDKAARRRVYQEEFRLMREFDPLIFDFNTIASDAIHSPAILPDDLHGQIILYQG